MPNELCGQPKCRAYRLTVSEFERLGGVLWSQSFRSRLGLLAKKRYIELYGKEPRELAVRRTLSTATKSASIHAVYLRTPIGNWRGSTFATDGSAMVALIRCKHPLLTARTRRPFLGEPEGTALLPITTI